MIVITVITTKAFTLTMKLEMSLICFQRKVIVLIKKKETKTSTAKGSMCNSTHYVDYCDRQDSEGIMMIGKA